MTTKAASRTLFIALAAGLFAASAFAQWQWIDKDGRKVYSDRSPPAEIKEKDILKRPFGSTRPAAPEPATDAAAPVAAAAASAPANKASAPKLSGKDAALEAKKKQSEVEDAAKKKADDEKIAKANADNCEQAKRGMAVLKSGARVSSVNAKGEREVLDDAKRAAETKRAQESIDSSCK